MGTLFNTGGSEAELFVFVGFGLEGDWVVDSGRWTAVFTCPAVIEVSTGQTIGVFGPSTTSSTLDMAAVTGFRALTARTAR